MLVTSPSLIFLLEIHDLHVLDEYIADPITHILWIKPDLLTLFNLNLNSATVCFYTLTSVWPTDWLSLTVCRWSCDQEFPIYPPWPAFDFPWHTLFSDIEISPSLTLSYLSNFTLPVYRLSVQPWPTLFTFIAKLSPP